MSNFVVVLRTHRLDDPEIIKLYEKIRAECGLFRTYVILDITNKRSTIPKSINSDDVFLVSDGDCIAANSMHDKGYSGNSSVSWMFWHPETSFVLCHDWLRSKEKAGTCPSFDYVWFVEYDVRCGGSFQDTLSVCNQIEADFMACGTSEGGDRLRLAKEDPGWCWFPRLDGEIAKRVTHHDRVGAFFPMVRISTPMSEVIKREFGKSTGFCEVYIPTLASVTPGLVAKAMPAQVLGKFRYSPNISREEWKQIELSHRNAPDRPSLLYHPIK